ncbi:MAG: ribonuclease III [Akkermansia sp.]|nr:ribonuclease III [Akkermansia sp.]MBR6576068.1 ribonuclease III [Akkermansia sp.]
MDRAVVEKSLDYVFTDEVWLKQALTHPSSDQKRSTNLNYERLEFLGDAVLELVVSRELFTRYPKADEGELTKMRSAIVSRAHLSGLAARLGWGEQLTLSPQLEANGGRKALSILANTFESVIGAVMMDSNYNAARKVTLMLMQESLDKAHTLISVNYKGELLEKLQSINNEGPKYVIELVDEQKPAGPFRARVFWSGREIGCAEGQSKHKAEVAAAAKALEQKLFEN